jgi:hypothetical protein
MKAMELPGPLANVSLFLTEFHSGDICDRWAFPAASLSSLKAFLSRFKAFSIPWAHSPMLFLVIVQK